MPVQNPFAGSATNPSVSSTGTAVPASATYIGGIKSGNLVGLTLDGSSNLNVNIAANSFGTITVSGTVAATQSGNWTSRVVGNAGAIFDGATAASVPANAVQAGARAATTYPTAVTDGQLVAPMADKAGRLVTVCAATRDLIGTAVLSSSSSSAVSFIAAGGSGVFNDLVSFIATNESSTATIVSLSDNGAGGTVYKFALASNGGIVINFPTPLPQGTANVAWDVLNSAGVAVDYVAMFAKNK